MAIDLDNITSGFNISKINANFQKVEDYINDKLLARAETGVAGEAKMERDLDMDGYKILNADIDGSEITNDRAIRVPANEPSLDPLPPADSRKGTILSFNINTGLPETIVPSSGSAADVLNQIGNNSDITKGDALVGVKQPYANTVGRTQHDVNADYVSVKDWGAKGDGVTDDTAAIEAAWLAVTTKGTKYFPQHAVGESIYDWLSTNGPRLYFPAGRYIYRGTGLNLNDTVNQVPIFTIVGESKSSTEIWLDADTYLVDSAVNPWQFKITGIKCYGGLGLAKFSSVAQNQTQISEISDCFISAYRECAIGFSSQDWPNIKIVRNQFYGRTGYQTIGVMMCGWSANSEVVGNEFGLAEGAGVYAYAIKLNVAAADAGGYRGPTTPILIADNGIYRRNSVDGSATLWIVPNPSTNDNAGRAVVIRNNKWGAENINTSSYHVLIADESTTGTWGGNKRHLATKSSGFVRGLVFDKNNVRFEPNATQPYIASFTPHIQGMICEDIVDNTLPVTYLEFRGGMVYTDFNVQDYDNVIDTKYWLAPTATNYAGKPVSALSNFPATVHTIDELCFLNTPAQAVSNGQSDVVFRSLMTVSTSFAGTVTSATKTAIDNSLGINSEAANVVYTANFGRISYPLANFQASRIAWAEVELAQGDTNPISTVVVEVVESDTVKFARRVINVTAENRLYRIPFVLPPGITTVTFRIVGAGYTATTSTLKVGRVFVYHASEPVATGNVRSLGSAWNTQHIILGGYHLWVDGSGVLRIKNGAPTSATDGTVVGAQT